MAAPLEQDLIPVSEFKKSVAELLEDIVIANVLQTAGRRAAHITSHWDLDSAGVQLRPFGMSSFVSQDMTVYLLSTNDQGETTLV